MPQEALRHGFGLAHRRIGLIFVDLLWKAIWLAITAAAVMLTVMWFGAPLRSIQWQQSNIPGVNAWLVATLIRQLWEERGSELLLAVFGALVISKLAWLFLEAFCRRLIVQDVFLNVVAGFSPRSLTQKERRLKPATTCSFKVFLGSSIIKLVFLATTGATLGLLVFGRYIATPLSEWPALWLETRGAAIAGIAAFLGLAFFLTIIDTLVRSDALELFGTDLFHVSAVIGVLVLFESMIGASLAIVIAAGFLNISRASGAIVMIGVASLAVLFWTLIHSYLLLVRFTAVGIMRRNAVDI